MGAWLGGAGRTPFPQEDTVRIPRDTSPLAGGRPPPLKRPRGPWVYPCRTARAFCTFETVRMTVAGPVPVVVAWAHFMLTLA